MSETTQIDRAELLHALPKGEHKEMLRAVLRDLDAVEAELAVYKEAVGTLTKCCAAPSKFSITDDRPHGLVYFNGVICSKCGQRVMSFNGEALGGPVGGP